MAPCNIFSAYSKHDKICINNIIKNKYKTALQVCMQISLYYLKLTIFLRENPHPYKTALALKVDGAEHTCVPLESYELVSTGRIGHFLDRLAASFIRPIVSSVRRNQNKQ